MSCLNGAYLNEITNKMTIEFNVFGAFVEDRIGCDVESGLVITIKSDQLGMRNLKSSQDVTKPSQF